MQQFSNVIRELRTWLLSFSFIQVLSPFRLYLLFGGIGVGFLQALLFKVLPYSSYGVLDFMFYTIPLSAVAGYSFLLGVWLTLISSDIKYLPYGLWAKAVLILFPFMAISVNSLISVAVYAYLGYLAFKYLASSFAEQTA